MFRNTIQVLLFLLLWSALSAGIASADDPGARGSSENIEQRLASVTDDDAALLSLEIAGMSFTLHGLLEIEAFQEHPQGGDAHGETNLSTAQIGLDAVFNEYLSGSIIVLWEEDDTEPAEIDEAALALHLPDALGTQTPFLYFGRQYLPFGQFNSGMISDPLTLDLGETHRTSAVFGLEGGLWTIRAAVFDDYTAAKGDDDSLDSRVLSLELVPYPELTLGASWINDLAESDSDLVQDERFYNDNVPAISAFLSMQRDALGLEFEYLTAVEDFDSPLVAVGEDLTGQRPQAWNLELLWTATDRLELAGRYEEAEDYQADVRRYGATASFGLCDYALLAAEYLHSDAKGEDGTPTHLWTAQLAIEF